LVTYVTRRRRRPPTAPARQVDEPVTLAREVPREAAKTNLWTGRTLREYRAPREGRGVRNVSGYRCAPALDAGWTRGEGAGIVHHCLYFAKGLCHLGPACGFLHRVPTVEDSEALARDHALDCFGKERSGADGFRAGSKGAGALARDCTTLYIYLGSAANVAPKPELEAALRSEFEEWGDVDDVHAAPAKAVAFVRYARRAAAEFAKAAMHQQQLRPLLEKYPASSDHVLDVRWADDDSSPIKAAAELERRRAALLHARAEAADAAGPDAKRARVLADELALAHRPGAATAAYPDTSDAFDRAGGGGAAGPVGAYQFGGASAVDVYPDTSAQFGPPRSARQEETQIWQQEAPSLGAAAAAEEQAAEQDGGGGGAAEALGLIGSYGSSSDGG
jgi:hypothetical protein